jgi:hypothetical protein
LVDLPNFAVIVAGLGAWDPPREEIKEDRLLNAVRAKLGPQVAKLAAMPWSESTDNPYDDWARIGVPVFPFPRWFRCTACNVLSTIDGGLFQLQKNERRIERTRYVHEGCGRGSSPLAVPARFVIACERGHLDEFPWIAFAHQYATCPNGTPSLELTEPGSGTRSTDVYVKCTQCGMGNSMNAAFDRDAKDVPQCRGRHPHLRDFDPEGCEQRARTLLLGASNTWFGITRSALAIPVSSDGQLDVEVDAAWGDLADADSEHVLDLFVRKLPSLRHLTSFPMADLWEAVRRRRANQDADQPEDAIDLKFPEWQCITNPSTAPSTYDFTIEDAGVPATLSAVFEQVVAVKRLRETMALLGFARIDAPESGVNDDLEAVEAVSLSRREPTWVPASDVRGEGIFFRLPEERVRGWQVRVETHPRMTALRKATIDRFGIKAWPGFRYVLLHSLAHLLINELSLECGYSPASIRERIYSSDEDGQAMAGILVYTAAADSEGTLGGLVSMAKPECVERIVSQARTRAEMCSSDPLCSEHVPTDPDKTLHGAACHSCLFLPETSCERGNRLLDRTILVKTISESSLAYLG